MPREIDLECVAGVFSSCVEYSGIRAQRVYGDVTRETLDVLKDPYGHASGNVYVGGFRS